MPIKGTILRRVSDMKGDSEAKCGRVVGKGNGEIQWIEKMIPFQNRRYKFVKDNFEN